MGSLDQKRRTDRIETRGDEEPTGGAARLDPVALGLAFGTAWGLAVGVVGIGANVGWGKHWRALLSDVYVGFEPGEGSTAAGIGWGFVDGFVGGVLVGWLYNRYRTENRPRQRYGW